MTINYNACFEGLVTETGSPCISTTVGQWLANLNLADYESLFLKYGFDDIDFIVSNDLE